jgi:hypothetical protein
MSNNLTKTHYDRPYTSSQSQTIFKISSHKIYAMSMKLLDLKVTPLDNDGNVVPSYFPTSVGAYSCIRRVQLKLKSLEVDNFYAQSILPLLLSELSNEEQKGLASVLHLSGAGVSYDQASKKLVFDRPVSTENSASLKLGVYLDLLNKIGVIDTKANDLELIIDWERDVNKIFIPVDSTNKATKFTINIPYLSYESFVGVHASMEQPDNVTFVQRVEDVFNIEANSSVGTSVTNQIRSNAFQQKTVGRMLFVNKPRTIEDGNPAADMTELYNAFGFYQSTPMYLENMNVSQTGQNIFTMRGTSNPGVSLATVADCWGPFNFVSTGHYHSKDSVLKDLPGNANNGKSLNGFAGYTGIILNRRINKELQVTYSRTAPSNITVGAGYPSLASQMSLFACGEVFCVLKNGVREYV